MTSAVGARTTPAGEFFAWRPAGVGSLWVPCARCGGGALVRLLENLLEALCPACGRNVALERVRQLREEAGVAQLAERLVGLGILSREDLDAFRPEPGAPLADDLVERLLDTGSLRRDLRAMVELDLEEGWYAYGAAPLRDVVLPEEVERALEARRERGGVLAELLREAALDRLAATIRSVGPDVSMECLPEASSLDPAFCHEALPRRAMEVFRAVPIRREPSPGSSDSALVVGLWNPLDFQLVKDLEALVGGPVHPVLAEPAAINAALGVLGVSFEASEDSGLHARPDLDLPPWEFGEDPFEGILLEALEEGAQEVLVEPRGSQASLRFRVRGELRKARLMPAEVAALLVERLGNLAANAEEEQVGELSRTQSGTARCDVSGLPVNLGFRILETPLGPSLALELEGDEQDADTGLGQLGLSLSALAELEAILAGGSGLVVVASPSRSSKTEAYLALLERVVRLGKGVVSLERRIKRVIPGVTQLDLEPGRGRLDPLLHPTPDWLGLDGSLDGPALRLAMDVVLSGGGAIVTVPAPDGATALLRLTMAGLPRELLRRTVRVVLARLVLGRNCPHCRIQLPGPADQADWVAIGCAACSDQGTSGTLALAELVRLGEGTSEPVADSRLLADRARELVEMGEVRREPVQDLLRD